MLIRGIRRTASTTIEQNKDKADFSASPGIAIREYPADDGAAKKLIEKKRLLTENANRPHGYGLITPSNFSPFPKNPVIARFFREIGRADELGSGVRNLFKHVRLYSGGADPQLIEEDIFKIIIPLTKEDEGLSGGLSEGLSSLLEIIKSHPGIKAKHIPPLLDNRPLKTIERQIKILRDKSLIERRGSKKTGGYYLKDG